MRRLLPVRTPMTTRNAIALSQLRAGSLFGAERAAAAFFGWQRRPIGTNTGGCLLTSVEDAARPLLAHSPLPIVPQAIVTDPSVESSICSEISECSESSFSEFQPSANQVLPASAFDQLVDAASSALDRQLLLQEIRDVALTRKDSLSKVLPCDRRRVLKEIRWHSIKERTVLHRFADFVGHWSRRCAVVNVSASTGSKKKKAKTRKMDFRKELRTSLKLTEEEKQSITAYTSNKCFRQINTALRNRQDFEDNKVRHVATKLRSALRKIFLNCTGKAQVAMVYRGLDLPPHVVEESFRVGGTYTDLAFMSTSMDDNFPRVIVEKDPATNGNVPVLLKIECSAGALPIKGYSEFKEENEALFAPRSFFRVKDVQTEGPVKVVTMKELW